LHFTSTWVKIFTIIESISYLFVLKGTDMEDNMVAELGRKPYSKPEIAHEIDLEVRAGSPIPGLSPLDPSIDSDS
jgi:hypothetical protein